MAMARRGGDEDVGGQPVPITFRGKGIHALEEHLAFQAGHELAEDTALFLASRGTQTSTTYSRGEAGGVLVGAGEDGVRLPASRMPVRPVA